VYSAPSGATNDWLFMGDSITFITMPRAFSDLPSLVEKAKAGDYPAIIDAAIGGTTTVTAEDAIVETMKGFPGKYVVLAYGTNDHSDDFQMESLVKSVIAAGKTPVVPHMPWADGADTQMKGPIINGIIDDLYKKYPQIVVGPDLWALFLNRTDLIPSGDIHPNSAGQEVLRTAWSTVLAKTIP
jgi:lysophospholipase L1-like esterase